jgi:integral membrane protein (TIGR01906 family)
VLALRWTAAALFILSIPLLLVLTNVRIAATDVHVYQYSFRHYDVAPVTGVSLPELDQAARDIVAYFETSPRSALLDVRVEQNGEQVPLFNQKEVLHMRDVRNLFQSVFHLQELAFVYAVGYVVAVFIWSRERSLRRLARLATIAGALTALLLAVSAIAVMVGFDQLFTEFHVISFANDFWQLDPARDHLIQMFPQGFWFDVTLGVVVMTVLEGGLLAAAGMGYLAWVDRDRPGWRTRWPLPLPRW